MSAAWFAAVGGKKLKVKVKVSTSGPVLISRTGRYVAALTHRRS